MKSAYELREIRYDTDGHRDDVSLRMHFLSLENAKNAAIAHNNALFKAHIDELQIQRSREITRRKEYDALADAGLRPKKEWPDLDEVPTMEDLRSEAWSRLMSGYRYVEQITFEDAEGK